MQKSITIVLTVDEARAPADAAVDCVMEGLPIRDVEPNAEETWGPRWRQLRKAALAAADKLTLRVNRAAR